jgi:nitric oxide reductase large subunit
MLLLQSGKPGIKWVRLTLHVTRFDRSEVFHSWAIRIIQCGVPLYLVAGAFLLPGVPPDIAVSSLILLIMLLGRLAWARHLRFLPLRLLVFPGIAFLIYLMHRDHAVMELFPPIVRIGFVVVLLALMLLAIRTAKDQKFQTTPTDLLVVALAGGVGVLYQQGMIEAALVPVVLVIVVFFYAAELVMRYMRRTWNCFTVGMVAVLALLSVRLL